ncbi:MAG: membrane protein insertase YidC [Holosporaceae bacterium]|jgi:YidC/Oxa1 family membrane protein insertase|nr:membrane protein insertase YidC [Holosporaceae bacterium]
MEEEKRNVLLFFAVSVLIMVGYPYFFNGGGHPSSAKIDGPVSMADGGNAAPNVPKKSPPAIHPAPQYKIKHIKIKTNDLSGVISSRGAKIDNVCLAKYRKNLDGSESAPVLGEENGRYFAQTDWTSDNPSDVLPDEHTCWKTDSTELSEGSPVTLTWENGNGLVFEKHISIDDNYLITIVDVVKNHGTANVTLKSRARIHRELAQKADGAMSFYEGPLGYLNGKLEEISYDNIAKKSEIRHETTGGWFGITDKYWLVAFIPHQSLNYKVFYRHSAQSDKSIFNVESTDNAVTVAPSVEISKTHRLFVGAKEIKTLDMYEDKLQIKHLDMALDFGYLYIITKPMLYALAYAKDLVGNMGLGILLITLLIKLVLFPLANKSYRSMNHMKKIQPKIQALQAKYADDKVKLGQEVSELYKKEGVNPVGGCLPNLLQFPVLFALYKVLYISIEMRQAPFIGWIHDLSLPDPLVVFNLFGLLPLDLPGFLQIGIWPIIMGVSMFLQQKMGGMTSPDPAQATMMLCMPVIFTFMLAQLPSGLVIYWTFSNILGIIQQYAIMKIDENSRAREKMKKT